MMIIISPSLSCLVSKQSRDCTFYTHSRENYVDTKAYHTTYTQVYCMYVVCRRNIRGEAKK